MEQAASATGARERSIFRDGVFHRGAKEIPIDKEKQRRQLRWRGDDWPEGWGALVGMRTV